MLRLFWRPYTIIILLAASVFTACHQVQEVPFPSNLADYPQPQTFPLEFTEPIPLHWDTVGRQIITPTSFSLDFQKLKGMVYDASGFKPISYPVTSASFDLAALPSKSFDLDAMKAHPIRVETAVLHLPATSVKMQRPDRVTEATVDMRAWQQVGLLNTTIYGMAKDPAGLLWFATKSGIYRYDGMMLTNMIPSIYSFGLCFDREGDLWYIGGINANETAIVNVDLTSRVTTTYLVDFGITSIARIASDNDGHIWVSGDVNARPAMIDPEKKVYYTFDAELGNSSRYYFLTVDSHGRIWNGSRNGIQIIDPKAGKVVRIGSQQGLPNDTITAILPGADGLVWAAGPNDVNAIDMQSGKITRYRLNSMDGIARVYCLQQDLAGQLWIGRTDGLHIINPGNGTFRHIGNAEGLSYDNVVDMAIGANGEIVAAGYSFPLARSIIYTLTQNGKTVYPFKNTPIISATEDSKGNLWVGTESELLVLDSARTTYWQLDTANGLANPFIQSITEQEGKVVITTNGGYNIFDPSRSELLRVTRKEGLLTDSIYSLLTDHQGNLWITGTSEGIFKYDVATGYVLNLSAKGGLNGNFIVQASTFPGSNDVWMVTVESGPNIIDVKNNTIRFIKNIPGMDTVSYKGLSVDGGNRVWVTGTGGYSLYMIDRAGKKVARFTTREGLSGNSTYSLVEYKGKLLLCVEQKVNIITPPEASSRHRWEVNVLRHSEGFRKLTTSFISDAISRRGDYLWGDTGMGIVYGIAADTSSGSNFLTAVKVMGKQLVFAEGSQVPASDTTLRNDTQFSSAGYTEKSEDLRWDSLSGPYAIPVNLSLPHDQNIIQFSFSEVSAGRPDSIEFAYILEGIDKAWTITKDLQTETYLNLTPGNYIFKVASRWHSGKWNEPAVFRFSVRPPWYSTWWAYLLYAVAALSLLRLYIIFRSRKLLRANKLLEEKVDQRTEELQRSYDNVEQLGKIGRKITSSLSVEKIIATAYQNVNALMDAAMFGIGIYNPQQEMLEFPATFESGEQLAPYTNQLNDSNRFSAVCFNTGREIVMGNVEEEYSQYVGRYLRPAAGQHAHSLVYLPLIINEKKLGVITVQSFKKNAYSDNDLNILHNIATYTAIALENAASYSKLDQSLEHLKKTQKQLIQSEKMASLGELTAGIAHEIQNPLNFVNNFSEVNMDLIREMDEEIEKGNYDEVRELSANIRSNEEKIIFHGKRADGIVKSMLQHSRSTGTAKELTDINSLCDEYLRLAFHGMRAKDKSFNSGMETDFDDQTGKVRIVPQHIGRVLLNLLTNAFYEVNEKRKTAASGYRPMVKMSTRNTGNGVRIEVTDNGNGISEEVKNKIFQPFFTTKPTGRGTGLGLSLSYDIITKEHNGAITIDSEPGRFTTFTVTLPQVLQDKE